MNVEIKELEKSQIEVTVELDFDVFNKYIEKGAEKLSQEIKIEGFRPGKAPLDIVKRKVGEIAILEEGARIAINKTIGEVFDKHVSKTAIGEPDIRITKLAPGNPLEYKIVVSVLPEITLGDYRQAPVNRGKVEIADDEVGKLAAELAEMRTREVLAERPVQEGDKAVVDIDMFLDNVPIEGGQGKNVAVIIGKGYVVPGFDKHLVGMKKGDQREFALPYPKDYHQASLAGKMVEFRARLVEVFERQVPALDDELARGFGFNSMSDLKEQLGKNLADDKNRKADEQAEIEMLEKIVADSKFGPIPELLVRDEMRKMIDELKAEVERQGGKFEDYLASIRKTDNELMIDFSPNAMKRLKVALAVREIAIAEKIDASEKEIDHEIDHLLSHYKGSEKIEAHIKNPDYRPVVRNQIINRKVISLLKEANIRQ